MPDERQHQSTIVLAGGTGHLGRLIARALSERRAIVRAIVRPGTKPERLGPLREAGATVVAVDLADRDGLVRACDGAGCVVSALNGLEETIVTGQTALLDAAVAAGVPRFVPSDFSLDFTRITPGRNRNFDLRAAFRDRLDRAPIAATSIFNGGFADLLKGDAPLVVDRFRRVLYVENQDVPMDFTTMADTAAFTAEAALDPATPRDLHIAGSRITARELAADMTALRGVEYRPFRAGSLRTLRGLTRLVRTLYPASGQVFPPWQGMMYMHDLFSGEAGTPPLDNERYPSLRWTPVREVLA